MLNNLIHNPTYKLLPFKFMRQGARFNNEILVTNENGEYLFLSDEQLKATINHSLDKKLDIYKDLLARHFIYEPHIHNPLTEITAQYQSRKSFIFGGPALHLFVVTLRCNHACQYCQVSSSSPTKQGYDLTEANAKHAVDRLFESPSPVLTVEFQGGEPLLHFSRVKQIIELVNEKNLIEKRNIQFVISTTLHHLTDEIINVAKEHSIHFSSSLDGPAFIHNTNRPTPERNSYEKTIEGMERIRAELGHHSVSALTTITAKSLQYPHEIIDEYVTRGFNSISLRSLSYLGFAKKSIKRLGYSAEEFVKFYNEALSYLIEINKQGTFISETYASFFLTNILTPFSHGYVNLRSLTGEGMGALVYNYDGYVYPSDEARMLNEMGESGLRLGHISQTLKELFRSPAMELLLSAGVIEALPQCNDCAYQPYCGVDPVDHYARYSDPIGHRVKSNFCKKHKGLFTHLFGLLWKKDEDTMRILLSWLNNRSITEIPHVGYKG